MEILALALKGRTREDIFELVVAFVNSGKVRLFDYAKPLLLTIKNAGFELHIVSSSTPEIIKGYLFDLDIDIKISATELEFERDGYSTGKLIKVNNGKNKIEYISRFTKNNYTIAFGDSDGDIPMLSAVDTGIFLNPEDNCLTEETDQTIIKETDPQKLIQLVLQQIDTP